MGNLEVQLEGFAAGVLWFYAALVLLEALLELRGNTHFYRLKDTLCSIATGLAYTGVQVLMRGVFFGAMFFVSQFAPWQLETTPLTFVLCYLAVDFAFYWHHRLRLLSDGSGRWIWSTPDEEIQTADAGELQVVPLGRNALFPEGYHEYLYAFGATGVTPALLADLETMA